MIQVKKVLRSRNQVVIQVLNVEFVFGRNKRKIKILSKRKPDAQIHDPAACWVPAHLFNQACRQAAAILLSPKSPKKQKQISLFDKVPTR